MDWTTRVQAPCLRHVGGDLIANMAEILDAPRLRFVGGDLEVSDLTRHITVNNLEIVGGNFYAEGAAVLHAPSLKRIGKTLDTSKDSDFYNPGISIGEYWFVHPEARQNWMARRARYHLMLMPSMEI
jgi:hypothetical protein